MKSSFFKRIKYGKEVNDKIFLRNGKILLEELITSNIGKRNPIRDFSAKELQIATSNYNKQKVIMEGFFYILYKGFLGNYPIIVMKFKEKLSYSLEGSINNIVFASQTSHKNILKLTGCCLKTEIPIIVLEWVGYGVLYDYICGYQDQRHFKALVWRDRLRIAMEISNAVAYLHVGFPRSIIHEHVTPYNILLDEQYAAKLFDFSLSKIIPEGETYIKDPNWCGANGFLAPECVQGTDFNEKCDVYSFGGLLLVLFTGKEIYSQNPKYKNTCDFLWVYGKEYYQENKLNEIVDPIIIGDETFPEKDQQLLAFVELALKCGSESAEDRPTMVDVAKQLRQMYKSSMNVP